MNRKALILYIRDLRDLEIAARRIERLYQEEKKDYEQVLDSLENGKFMSEIEEPIFGVLMGCGVCFLMGYFCNWLKKLVALQLWNYCFFGVAIFFWFMGIVFLFAVISGVLENSRKRDEAQKNNAREEKRIADNQELINQVKSNWKKKETYIQSEYRKVYELKKNYYDQNILAKPYRNLPALIYIYDYMSTSSASLSETLLHEHIDYGIKKIVERETTSINCRQQYNNVVLRLSLKFNNNNKKNKTVPKTNVIDPTNNSTENKSPNDIL